jgi:hypothetical protein
MDEANALALLVSCDAATEEREEDKRKRQSYRLRAEYSQDESTQGQQTLIFYE